MQSVDLQKAEMSVDNTAGMSVDSMAEKPKAKDPKHHWIAVPGHNNLKKPRFLTEMGLAADAGNKPSDDTFGGVETRNGSQPLAHIFIHLPE
jgi:hypothetical protein